MAQCPLARWFHKGGTDHSAGFGLHVEPGGHSNFNCFACKSGSAEQLLQMLEMYTKGDPPSLRDFKAARAVLADELQVLPVTWQEFQPSDKEFIPWPQQWLDSFQPCGDEVKNYLQNLRKNPISLDVIARWDLRFDNLRNMIVCPYRNADGVLAGARGRSILLDTDFKHYDYKWKEHNNAVMTWYHEEALNLPGWAAVVEGQADVWRTELGWKKTLGNLTAKPTEEKFRRLSLSHTPGIVHVTDNDEAGEESSAKFKTLCTHFKLGYRRAVIGSGIKDPDLCHPEYLKKIISESAPDF